MATKVTPEQRKRVIEIVRKKPNLIFQVDKSILDEEDIVLEACLVDPSLVSLIPSKHIKSENFLRVVEKHPRCVLKIFESFLSPKIVEIACRLDPSVQYHVPLHTLSAERLVNRIKNGTELNLSTFRSSFEGDLRHHLHNRQVAMALSERCSDYFRLLPPYFRMDFEFCKEVISKSPFAIKNVLCDADETLELAKEAMRVNVNVFHACPKAIRDTFHFALAAIKDYYLNYSYISERLRDDPELLKEGIRVDPQVLLYAKPKFRSSLNFIGEAMEISNSAYRYAGSEIFDDYSLTLRAVQNDGSMLHYAHDHLRDEREIVLIAVSSAACVFKVASTRLQDDKEIATIAIKSDPDMFQYASKRLRGDRDVGLLAIQTLIHGINYIHASLELRRDREFLKIAIRNTPNHDFIRSEEIKKLSKKIPQPLRRDDVFTRWLRMPYESRKVWARRRLIKGVLEEARIRRKYDPNGIFMKKLIENDQDFY